MLDLASQNALNKKPLMSRNFKICTLSLFKILDAIFLLKIPVNYGLQEKIPN